jgi:GH3 auxin-responsive promoter
MDMRSAAVNALWGAASAPSWERYRRALRAPAAAQERVLLSCLRRNAGTSFGREHGFDAVRSVADYQARIPPVSYDDIAPLVRRAAHGEARVLTRTTVERLVPTSGSTAAAKLVPFTADLRAEFTIAIDAWLVDLFMGRPALMGGPAYWSISPPASTVSSLDGSAVPVGFDSDSRYLGGARQALARSVLAVPDDVARVQDVEAFRYVTALFLVRARDLRLMSVWHPSFLEGLLDCIETHRDRLIHDVDRGSMSPPATVAAEVRARLAPLLAPDPARAMALRKAGAHAVDIWPHLSLISCWADGPARAAAALLARRCEGIALQPKGLLATEAVVTIPFDGRHPLAIRSHFFEFVEPDGRVRLAHELQRGMEYTLLLTTGGGLYRYKLGDRVMVNDFVLYTPSLRFLGKDDRVSDLFGEKLSDGFVARVLEQLFIGAPPRFALLAPDRTAAGIAYTLFVASDRPTEPDLAARLERGLRLNPQYAWCVDLGQLGPARVARVGPGAMSAFIAASVARGQRLGDVKPVSLSAAAGWRDHLPQLDVEAAC